MLLEPPRADLAAEATEGLAVSSGWFPIFEPPLLHGNAWTAAEDAAAARVVVISRKLSEKLFGDENPVGRPLRLADREFKVVGVLDNWKPIPRYSHLINGRFGAFSGEDDIYVPFATAVASQVPSNGSTNCSSGSARPRTPGYQGLLESECTWIQLWFEGKSVAERGALLDYFNGYVAEQRRLGRFERKVPARIFDVREWMAYLQVISNDTRLAVWLSFGFLLLCLVNTVGLLLAKFSVRAPEVGVRRALGATRSAIFRQFLVEAGVVGIVGGMLGLVLSIGCLALIETQSRNMSGVAHMDLPMLALTFVLAIVASLLAGLLPTWRAAQVTPALQLKSQ